MICKKIKGVEKKQSITKTLSWFFENFKKIDAFLEFLPRKNEKKIQMN